MDGVDYDDLDNYNDNYDFADDDEYRKIGRVRRLFKGFDRDYYKPIRTDDGFDRRRNYYMEYTSRGDRYENVSLKEYLKMIRSYLRDLRNNHKPTTELNNEEDNSDTERGEWKIQLVLQNNCISTKEFEETCTIYSASKPVIDRLFDTTLQRFQQAIETSNERGSQFTHESVVLLYYYFQKIDIRRAESYIASADWLVNKEATINSENKKDNKCFQYVITIVLNYHKI